MAIPYLIKIDGSSLPKLRAFKIGRNKLWADANRNLNGDLKASYIGMFPKITLEFAPTTTSEMSTLLALLDQPDFDVTWWDEQADKLTTGTYYSGDFEVPMLRLDTELYDAFTVNLVPFNSLASMSQ